MWVLPVLSPRAACPTHRGFCDVWARDESELALKVQPETHPNPDPTKIWQKRFYDFNVWSAKKHAEKLEYIHSNPVKRGLVERPEQWPWSSFRAYLYGETGPVRVRFQQWPLEINLRPIQSFSSLGSPLIRKESK